MDDRNVILEIRAGTGGDEASLFAGDLFRMYERFAAKQGWKVEVVSASEGSMGGYKEIVAEIRGRGAFAKLKFESGRASRAARARHRGLGPHPHLDRDGGGAAGSARRSTSSSTTPISRSTRCAPAAPAASTSTRPSSAIRVTHIPTGIVVMMQEDRSQHRNRAKAMAVLRARLYDHERQKQDAARAAERRGQVGSGDRSERIRTYNFPQGRVSDHRINLTLYKLPQIIEGEALGEIIDALVTEHQAELLAAEGACERVRTVTSRGGFPSAAGSDACALRDTAMGPRFRGDDRTSMPAAAAVGAAISRRRPRHARPRCAHSRRPCARPRPRRAGDAGRAPPDASRERCNRGARAAAARARAGRAHRRREGILGARAQAQCRHPGAAAGDRDRGRGGARGASRERAAQRAAHRRSRHRLRRPAAGAAFRAAGGARRRHRHQRRRARLRPRQCRGARAWRPRGVRRLRSTARRCAARFDLVVCQSALCGARRHRRRCSRRCATSIRARRSTAAAMDLPPIARSRRCAPAAGAATACWCSNSARASCDAVTSLAAAAGPAPAAAHRVRSCRRAARARRQGLAIGLCALSRGTACRLHNSGTQKSTWIVGQERLGFAQELIPDAEQEPAATLRRATGAKTRNIAGRTSGNRFAFLGSRCFIGWAPPAITHRRSVAHDERWATPQERLR